MLVVLNLLTTFYYVTSLFPRVRKELNPPMDAFKHVSGLDDHVRFMVKITRFWMNLALEDNN